MAWMSDEQFNGRSQLCDFIELFPPGAGLCGGMYPLGLNDPMDLPIHPSMCQDSAIPGWFRPFDAANSIEAGCNGATPGLNPFESNPGLEISRAKRGEVLRRYLGWSSGLQQETLCFNVRIKRTVVTVLMDPENGVLVSPITVVSSPFGICSKDYNPGGPEGAQPGDTFVACRQRSGGIGGIETLWNTTKTTGGVSKDMSPNLKGSGTMKDLAASKCGSDFLGSLRAACRLMDDGTITGPMTNIWEQVVTEIISVVPCESSQCKKEVPNFEYGGVKDALKLWDKDKFNETNFYGDLFNPLFDPEGILQTHLYALGGIDPKALLEDARQLQQDIRNGMKFVHFAESVAAGAYTNLLPSFLTAIGDALEDEDASLAFDIASFAASFATEVGELTDIVGNIKDAIEWFSENAKHLSNYDIENLLNLCTHGLPRDKFCEMLDKLDSSTPKEIEDAIKNFFNNNNHADFVKDLFDNVTANIPNLNPFGQTTSTAVTSSQKVSGKLSGTIIDSFLDEF